MPLVTPSEVSCFGSREHFQLAEWLEKRLNDFSRKLVERSYLPPPRAANEPEARAAAHELLQYALTQAESTAEAGEYVASFSGKTFAELPRQGTSTSSIASDEDSAELIDTEDETSSPAQPQSSGIKISKNRGHEKSRKRTSSKKAINSEILEPDAGSIKVISEEVPSTTKPGVGIEDEVQIKQRKPRRVHFSSKVALAINDDSAIQDIKQTPHSTKTGFYIEDDDDDRERESDRTQLSEVSDIEDDGIRLGESANPMEDDLKVFITSMKIEKQEFREPQDEENELNDFLEVEINYYLGSNKTVLRKDFLLMDVSRTRKLKNAPISLAYEKELQFRQREIAVYTRIFPMLEDLIFNVDHGIITQLGVPTCFLGQYEAVDVVDNIPRVKPRFVDAFSYVPNYEAPPELIETETRAILITHNLEKLNYSYKKLNEKLTVREAYAVIRELAQIHAASWVLQQRNPEETLLNMFPFLLQPYMAVPIWATLCEEGCDEFSSILHARLEYQRALDGSTLIQRYRKLKGKFMETVTSLLRPPKFPCPTTLLHLDLDLGNICFRYGGEESSPAIDTTATGASTAKDEDDKEIDVRIKNWKLASVGSCTHDLAYLLLACLSPNDRREYTKRFISYYCHVFKITTAKMDHKINLKPKHLRQEYDRSMLLAILMVIGFPNDVEDTTDGTTLDGIIEALRDVSMAGLI